MGFGLVGVMNFDLRDYGRLMPQMHAGSRGTLACDARWDLGFVKGLQCFERLRASSHAGGPRMMFSATQMAWESSCKISPVTT